jgi:hypothetical protein
VPANKDVVLSEIKGMTSMTRGIIVAAKATASQTTELKIVN